MRVFVEGVRVEGLEDEAAARISRKLRKLLEEAVVRTPPSVSSRQFVEEALKLAIALEQILSSKK